MDADVIFVCATDSATELLRATQYASSSAEEDVVGLSAVPVRGFEAGTRVNHILGLEALNEVYAARR